MQNYITGLYIVTVLKPKQIIPYFPENIGFCVNWFDVSDVCDWVMFYIQNHSSVQNFVDSMFLTFIKQACRKLTKSSKYIYYITKSFYFK